MRASRGGRKGRVGYRCRRTLSTSARPSPLVSCLWPVGNPEFASLKSGIRSFHIVFVLEWDLQFPPPPASNTFERFIMSEHHPASFATQILPRLSHLLRAVRRARLMAVALAVAGLLLCSPGGARAQTSSLDFDDTGVLESLGRLIEHVQGLAKEYRSAGARKRELIISGLKNIIFDVYNNATGDYSTISLQTTDRMPAAAARTSAATEPVSSATSTTASTPPSMLFAGLKDRTLQISARLAVQHLLLLRLTPTKTVPSSWAFPILRRKAPSNMPSAGRPVAWLISARRAVQEVTLVPLA